MTTHSTRTLRALEELRNYVYPYFNVVQGRDENSVVELCNVEHYGEFEQSTRLVILNDGSFTANVLAHELTPGQKFGVFNFSAELVAHLGELCAALREEQSSAE